MKNTIKFFLIPMILLFTYSCNIDKNRLIPEYSKIFSLEHTCESSMLFNNISYICLENKKESIFANINKLIIRDSLLYVGDMRGRKQILCFDFQGKFINSFGRIGRGPGEYIRITDFDIDNQGSVYIYSSHIKKIIKYNSSGEFEKEHRLPFYGFGFKILNNGKTMFAISNEVGSNHAMYYILDQGFKIEDALFKYDRKDKVNRGSENYIVKHNNHFISYIPTRNQFYIFDSIGENARSYYLDFGAYESPNEILFDAFDHGDFRDVGNHRFLNDTPYFLDNMLFCEITTGSKKDDYGMLRFQSICVIDTIRDETYSQKISPVDYSHRGTYPYLTTLMDTVLISYMDREAYDLDVDKDLIPEHVRKHILNNGIVITLKSSLCIQKK